MATLETLEERVRSLEQEVAQLRAISSHQPSRNGKNGIESMIGIMSDCPGFEDVVRYGKEFRNSDRPDDSDDA